MKLLGMLVGRLKIKDVELKRILLPTSCNKIILKSKILNLKSKSGFTLVELLIVIALFIIVLAVGLPFTSHMQVSAQLNDAADGLVHTVRTAQERAQTRFRGQAHGVYIDIQAGGDDSFVLYLGNSYSTRQSSFDRTTTLDSGLTLSTTLAGQDLNFAAGTATLNQSGITTTTITHGVAGHRNVVINSLGLVEIE
jgi:prepilin-type N-terminal cleavage/methylation domain-containing protein